MYKKYKNKKIAILGLGLEGKSLVKTMLAEGAEVWAHDIKEKKDLELTDIDEKKINLILGKKWLSKINKYFTIFRSPGVYRYKPKIRQAEKQGVIISSAIKLFFERFPGKIIGVTGTKGKGTTSTLIYKILKKSGYDIHLAGNIGKPYLDLINKSDKNTWVILEMSSFQLIDMTKSPHIAVVLNITSDHLDWHKNIEEYINAKKNIVLHQKSNDFVVSNSEYRISKDFAKLTKAKRYFFSKKKITNKGCYIHNGKIILNISKPIIIGKVDKLLLRGRHNWENITAAVCASSLAGAHIKNIRKVVYSFKGLEHRLELVGKIKDISFYNDSFSTNTQTVKAAVSSFTEPITLILGGFDKGLNYASLSKFLTKKKNIKNILLIGDIENKLFYELKKSKFLGKIFKMGKTSMKNIVKKSLEESKAGYVVLLSPGSSSFDMFKNYKDRGNKFKKAFYQLKVQN